MVQRLSEEFTCTLGGIGRPRTVGDRRTSADNGDHRDTPTLVTKIEEEVVVDIPLRITFDGLMEDGAFLGGGSAQTQGPPLEPSQEPPQEE